MNIIGHVSRKMTAVIFVFHVKPGGPFRWHKPPGLF